MEQNEEYYLKEIEMQSKCADDGKVCIIYPDDRHEVAGHDIMLSWAHLCVSEIRYVNSKLLINDNYCRRSDELCLRSSLPQN